MANGRSSSCNSVQIERLILSLFVIRQDNHEVNNGLASWHALCFVAMLQATVMVVTCVKRLLGMFATFFKTQMKDILLL